MNRSGRFAAVSSLVATLLLALALPVMGQEGDENPEEAPPETTVVVTDIEPAVVITLPPESAVTSDWTYRYLIPTGIAIAILVILATSGQYFTNVVRKRYRIVE